MPRVLVTAGLDSGLLWHRGNPVTEQRELAAGAAFVELANRESFTISGPDRIPWLNSLSSQKIPETGFFESFILDPQGRIEHYYAGFDDGEVCHGYTEPGRRAALLAFLESMRFRMQVEPKISAERVVFAGGRYQIGPMIGELPRREVGTWALDALRIAAGVPRIFVDTDTRTIPNELFEPDGDRLGPALHLKKGCYRGQETVARVLNVGRPPRRLTRLHLDGSVDRLPEAGAEVLLGETVVGWVGSSSRHYELGPIGLALIKRAVDPKAELVVDGIAAAQEVIVSPEVGLHVKFGSPRG